MGPETTKFHLFRKPEYVTIGTIFDQQPPMHPATASAAEAAHQAGPATASALGLAYPGHVTALEPAHLIG